MFRQHKREEPLCGDNDAFDVQEWMLAICEPESKTQLLQTNIWLIYVQGSRVQYFIHSIISQRRHGTCMYAHAWERICSCILFLPGPDVPPSHCSFVNSQLDWRYETHRERGTYQISKEYGRTDDPPETHVNIPLPASIHTDTHHWLTLHCKLL